MSGDDLQVIPEDLAAKAAQLRSLSWSTNAAQPTVVSPDALITSRVAIANLAVNIETMWAYQEFGRLEGLRLAQTLDNVAAAYADVDRISGEDIGTTMVGPGPPAVADGTRYPKSADLPAPPHPPSMPIPKGKLVSDQMLFPPDAQGALEAGDDGASLRAAAQLWRSNAHSLAASAQQFETNSLLWEGEAADAAYAKFDAYRAWITGLAGSWQRLAGEAERIAEAHSAAKRDNAPVARDFEKLQQEIAQNPASADNLRKTLQMAALQNQSEEIRNRYARDGWPHQIQPEDPPTPLVTGIPVTVDDHRRARRPLPGVGPHDGPGAGAGGIGDLRAEGETRVPSERPAISQTPAAEPTTQGAPQGGPPGGGSPAVGPQTGGSPGGGQPGSGQSGTGLPISPRGAPTLPTEPSVRPAASAGGGSGRFGGAGAMPGSPLQPAVGAEAVAPVITPAGPAAGAAAGGTTGGGIGGVGGMAPMMHGAKGEGSADKKRNPQLSEDEELYTEDRPWTEAVIGNRARRRASPEDTKKESQ
ncbi:MAG: PPE domain-containing protein [Actinomycetia bacterium]|nr:PPE domain-containing protein [Actinomycetes bacterium]